jgi:hypothetical protein
MASRHFTLFELHLDDAFVAPGAHFHDEDPRDVTDETTDEAERGASRFLAMFAVSLFVSIGATVLARRLAGADETDAEPIPIDEETETETIEA